MVGDGGAGTERLKKAAPLPLQVRNETRVFQEAEALKKQFAELNKVYPTQVLRTKKVLLDLMTVDEAIDSMEAVGHDFFVFR